MLLSANSILVLLPLLAAASPSSRPCGFRIAPCPGTSVCTPIDPLCTDTSRCRGICTAPQQTYASCGGFRVQPQGCSEGYTCRDDPRRSGCGMACDMPGICISDSQPTCGGFRGGVCLRIMTKINIAMVLDTVCPWCHIGHRNLLTARSLWLASNPSDTVSITYLPFQLVPDAPQASVDKRAYYAARFGADRMPLMQQRIASIGAPLGINFKFGGRVGNTHNSHRLVWLAQHRYGAEVARKTMEGLMVAYFEKEADITEMETLREIGLAAGVEGDVFDEAIGKGEDGKAEVEALVREAQRQGISGVPNFTIQDKYEISGGREPAAFLQVFERIKAAEQ
ncbi:hypothetical protein S40293_04390 [Stachybotrys chartarum IBT 40293]|nr:hypothetical protein S40293_04390 [Stachybotrys chartarum IBT 40293]